MSRDTTSNRLQRALDMRNFKQVDVLEKAKPFCAKFNTPLSKSDLSQYVSGKVQPGQRKLTILSLVLDVSEAWLMGFDVPMERAVQPATTSDCGLEADAIRAFVSLPAGSKEEAASYIRYLASKSGTK